MIIKNHLKLSSFFFFYKRFNFSTIHNNYEILGLSPNCWEKEIRLSYIRLAKIYHPDVYKGSDKERFKKIKEAYEILSIPEKRMEYDEKINAKQSKTDFKTEKNNEDYTSFGHSMYKDYANKENINIEAEYEKFMKTKRNLDPAEIFVSEDPFLSQLNYQERMRFEYVFMRNNKHLYELKYGHQQGYTKTVEDTIEILNFKKKKEIESDKFKAMEEKREEKMSKKRKLLYELGYFLIALPIAVVIGLFHGYTSKVFKKIDEKLEEAQAQEDIQNLHERIIFKWLIFQNLKKLFFFFSNKLEN